MQVHRRFVALCAAMFAFALLFVCPQSIAVAPLPVPMDNYNDCLPANAVTRFGTVRWRLTRDLLSLSWSGDGKYIVAGGYGNRLWRWEYNSGTEKSLSNTNVAPRVVQYLRKRQTVVFASVPKVGITDFKETEFMDCSVSNIVRNISVSADDRLLAIKSELNNVLVVDLEKQKLLHTWDIAGYALHDVAISGDGSLVAAVVEHRVPVETYSVRFWSTKTKKHVGDVSIGGRYGGSIHFHPSTNILMAWTNADNSVRFYDTTTFTQIRRSPVKPVGERLAISRDGNRYACWSNGSRHVDVCDFDTGKLIRSFSDCDSVSAVAFSPNGKQIVTGGHYHCLRLWDVETGREIQPRAGHRSAVVCLKFSPDGKSLASRGWDNTVRIWDVATAKQRHLLSIGDADRNHFGYVNFSPFLTGSLVYSPDGKKLAAVGGHVGKNGFRSLAIHLWNTKDPGKGETFTDDRSNSYSLGFSADNQFLFNCMAYRLDIRNLATGNSVGELNLPPREGSRATFGSIGMHLVVSPDGNTIATVDYYEIKTFDWREKQLLKTFGVVDRSMRKKPEGERIAHIDYSPGGQILAASRGYAIDYRRQHVCLYEPQTGEKLDSLSFEIDTSEWRTQHAIAFSPCGRMLAVAGGNGVVSVWDVFARRRIAAYTGHDGEVITVAWSPDGKLLASGGMDTTILLWDVSRLRLRPPVAGKDDPKNLAALLVGKNAAAAHRARWQLAGLGDKALPHLPATLRPVPKLDAVRVKKLIAQLNHDEADKRDEASAELRKLGPATEGLLRQALIDIDWAETRRRLRSLLDRIRDRRSADTELHHARAMLVLELAGTPAARARLAELAAGEPGAPLTRAAVQALARLRILAARK